MGTDKELKRIKVQFNVEQLDVINSLDGPEWDKLPLSIKVEKLISIALAYQPYWVEDKVFEVVPK